MYEDFSAVEHYIIVYYTEGINVVLWWSPPVGYSNERFKNIWFTISHTSRRTALASY